MKGDSEELYSKINMSTPKEAQATSTPMGSQPRNWSILSIPCAYGLAIAPHIYGTARGLLATGFTMSNISPRSNIDLLKGKIPEATLKTMVRARGAHLNALEVFPLFASAMVCSTSKALRGGNGMLIV